MFYLRYKQTARLRDERPVVDVTIQYKKGVPDNYLIGVVQSKIEIGTMCKGQMHLPPKELLLKKETSRKGLNFSMIFPTEDEARNYIALIERD